MTESERYEEKAHFDFANGQEFAIIKTLVAFANTSGGKIRLISFQCDCKRLDSARIDDLINKHVKPRIGGMTSIITADGGCEITVEKSRAAPHVFATYQSFKDEKGRDRTAWQVGHVPVRHSSKTEDASAEDFQRIIAERIQEVLSAIATSITNFRRYYTFRTQSAREVLE